MSERDELAGPRVLQDPDERVLVVARGRVHRQERGLVHGEDVLVLVGNRHVHRHRLLVPRRPPEEHLLLGLDPVVRAQALALPVEGAVADDELGPRAARPPELALQEDVETLARQLGRHPEDTEDGALLDPIRSLHPIDVGVGDADPAHRGFLARGPDWPEPC